MSITYKPTEPLEVGIGESMPAEFIKEAERSRSRTVSLTDEIERLKTENAKLWELVDGWDFCSKTKSSTFDNCVGCTLFIQTPHSYRCARDERMRELGIEV